MSDVKYYAHSGSPRNRSDWQLLSDHLDAVEGLARNRAAPLGLGAAAGIAGRLHDLGKYDPEFDRVLRGENVRVDHSTAGGRVLMERAPPQMRAVAEAIAYVILGHHAGLPDKTNSTGGSLDERVKRVAAVLDPANEAHLTVDFNAIAVELIQRVRRDPQKQGFDFSVAVRMVFSALVDADFRDTETFYSAHEGRGQDRDWPNLQSHLPDLRTHFDAYMTSFDTPSDLNRLRTDILTHVRSKAAMPPGLFTLSVPTGGGKTLTSLGFALDHAVLHGHTRIIYAIPYTSIIDQTAQTFRKVLGDEMVLEHHSAIEIEAGNEADREKDRLAMEDWAAPVVVTTTVQLFESLFAARTSRCRKLHNIAGAVIVLDEAQCLPRKLLLSTLAMIDTLAAQYGCTILLCTATQPAFDSANLKEGGLSLEGRELAPDLNHLSAALRRVQIVQGGEMDDTVLLAALDLAPQSFVIVNSRKHALDLYNAAQKAGLAGMVHLSTRQYPAQRRRIIAQIKQRLAAGKPCRLIATSLIEAGVDLDFPCGWRAEAGLDSVIQAAGRVNREGKRPLADARLTVFTAPENKAPAEVESLAQAMRSTAGRFPDLLVPQAVRDWFEAVYWRAGIKRLDPLGLKAKFVFGGNETNFAFREVATAYQMVDSPMVPVIIQVEPTAQEAVEKLDKPWERSGTLARALQIYTVQIPAKARDTLHRNGKGTFAAPKLRGDQFFVLTDASLYHEEFGLWWEQADYLAADQMVV
jgi:CRISPR-associated endonuclease/helicase Cas3